MVTQLEVTALKMIWENDPLRPIPGIDGLSKSHLLNCTEKVGGHNCTRHGNRFTLLSVVVLYAGNSMCFLLFFLEHGYRSQTEKKKRVMESASQLTKPTKSL